MSIVTKSSEDRRIATMTDATQTFTNNGYASGYDSVISEAFPCGSLLGKILTVFSQIVAVINGTSADHVTPVVQLSNDGTTWFTWKILELQSSSAVAAGTTWNWFLDMRNIVAVYMRINYVVHTSAHAAVADESTGSIKTQLAVPEAHLG